VHLREPFDSFPFDELRASGDKLRDCVKLRVSDTSTAIL
jgi:hypothetical protein